MSVKVAHHQAESHYIVCMRFFITFQIDLDKEKNEYGDILQLSIEEGYENLAYKTLAGFAWIWQQYGENLQWIIKLDDDLDLNLDKFLNKLPSTYGTKDNSSSLYCHAIMRKMPPVRNPYSVNRKM